MDPLKYPAIPDYLRVPSDLEEGFQAAMALRHTVEGHLCVLAAEPDPSRAQIKAQVLVEIALSCAKLASSLAICQMSDWLEEAEQPPAFRWRATSPGRRRQNQHTPPSGEVEC